MTEPKTTIFTLRLTPEERARLEKDAGNLALGEYVRLKLFGKNDRQAVSPRRKPKPPPLRFDFAAAKMVALLGKSELVPSHRTIAKAVKLGALPVSPETDLAIRKASNTIHETFSALLAALRVKER